jgi:hypothetical protein
MDYTGPCPEHLVERAEEPVGQPFPRAREGLVNRRLVGLDSLRREALPRRKP